MKKIALWNYTDISVKNGKTYLNPYKDVSVKGVFTAADGTVMELKGFWNGDGEWVVRFAPNKLGVWNYDITFSDGSEGANGELEAVAYEGENPLYIHGFLKTSENNRYLEYNDGTPFFWLADTHWLALGGRERLYESNSPLFKTMFHGMADLRAIQGYTVYQMNFFASAAGDCDGTGTSNEGGKIWQGEKFELINPDFFKNTDIRINYLVSKGITPCLGIDWGRYITSENVEGYKTITSYIVARYSAMPVVWFVAGEFGGSPEWPLWSELGKVIEAEDAYAHVTTIHGNGENFVEDPTVHKTNADVFRDEPWYDMVMIQTGHLPKVLERNVWRYYYDRTPRKPILESEHAYEGIWEVREPLSREQAYLAVIHGSFGITYGAEGVWDANWDTDDYHQVVPPWWPIPWYDAVLLPGAIHFGYLRKAFERLSWWKLEAGDHVRLTNPLGSMRDVAAKVSADKDELAAYYVGWTDKEYTTDVYVKNLNAGDVFEVEWFNPITAEVKKGGEFTVDENGELLLPKRQMPMADRLLIAKKKA